MWPDHAVSPKHRLGPKRPSLTLLAAPIKYPQKDIMNKSMWLVGTIFLNLIINKLFSKMQSTTDSLYLVITRGKITQAKVFVHRARLYLYVNKTSKTHYSCKMLAYYRHLGSMSREESWSATPAVTRVLVFFGLLWRAAPLRQAMECWEPILIRVIFIICPSVHHHKSTYLQTTISSIDQSGISPVVLNYREISNTLNSDRLRG
jgi:hypothetical protein